VALEPVVANEIYSGLQKVCDEAGLDASRASFIKYTMNAVFRVGSHIVRLSTGEFAIDHASRGVSVAQMLEIAEAPTIRLARLRVPQPIQSEGWVATVWDYVHASEMDPLPIDLASPLQNMHSLKVMPGAFGQWDPIPRFRKRIDRAANLSNKRAQEFAEWAKAEVGISAQELIGWLREQCDRREEELRDIQWHLPSGVIHADAHTGNILLRGRPTRPCADESAILCDLDGVTCGPPEWDLTPTAHGAIRFGRSRRDYDAFADAYGFDITMWEGWPTLRATRELQLTTSVIGDLAGRSGIAMQLAHRLRSMLSKNDAELWTRFS
jgi:hypothetical protein